MNPENKVIIFIKSLWENTVAPSLAALIRKHGENTNKIVEAIREDRPDAIVLKIDAADTAPTLLPNPGAITIDTTVATSISVTGLVAGSRVRILNTTDNVEIFNDVVAGTSHSSSVTWSADKTIEIWATKVGYLPFSSIATMTSGGVSFIAAQQADTVYTANAIDGSTVTEFSADYPNIQVDINDPDGVGYIKRFYA